MTRPQVVEGTTEEITAWLRGKAFAGRRMRVTIELEEDEEDFSDSLPEPPDTIRDAADLEQLLLEGLQSGPATPMTEADWKDIRHEVQSRVAGRKERASGSA